ncbi:hypothetical protein XU18_4556 [Perkinsela sp. CCAP 1560/4]|nr:hypothetical protein XU18_4556 [Perkinsela sp. CCAP 1560/4]|eukprot:KNH04132.1 hypothetical protein XU18_4556 [Perkinsela sp. CCAP 1560/4]
MNETLNNIYAFKMADIVQLPSLKVNMDSNACYFKTIYKRSEFPSCPHGFAEPRGRLVVFLQKITTAQRMVSEYFTITKTYLHSWLLVSFILRDYPIVGLEENGKVKTLKYSWKDCYKSFSRVRAKYVLIS